MAENYLQEWTQKQIEQAGTRKPKGIEPSRSVEVDYRATLRRLVRSVQADINQYVMPLLRDIAPQYQADSAIPTRDAWTDTLLATLRAVVTRWESPEFRAWAEGIAQQFVKSADQVNADRFRKDMKRFGIDILGDSPVISDYLSLSAADNVRLIRSIPEQYLTQIQSIIMANVRAGRRPAAIQKALVQQFGVAENRAKLIARDQTAKINSDLAQKRQQAAGFEYFRWVTSKDERVRDRHEQIAKADVGHGKGVYRYDDPPKGVTGNPIMPGSGEINCRCVAVPLTRREVEGEK
jgi:SPP1 gp7 family putative phage head morphogenesis protein